MKKVTVRLWSVLLVCTILAGLPPIDVLAWENRLSKTPPLAQTAEVSSPSAENIGSAQIPETDDYNSDTTVEIYTADDLAAAVAGQEDGQTWKIAEGTYSLTQDHLDQYAHWDAPGQGGWYFPLYADNLTITGDGKVVITCSVESVNGTWAMQDFVSVWGDGITIDGVNFQSKSEPNKAIEIMGKDFTLKNCTILPVVHPDGENGEVFSGSIYFNPANAEADLGNSILENVYLHAYISASAAKAGTLNVRNVTLDATNNIWSVWGTGYGPGLVGDVYGQVENVKYLVDEHGILSDILDFNSPYADDTKPGTTIVFAAGTYELDSSLTIGKDVVLVGAGKDRTIFQAASEPTVLLQVSGGDVDFSMSGIHIRGVAANSHNNSSGIQIGSNASPNTGDIVIDGCRFSDFTKNSITVKGGNITVTENIIDCKPYPGATGNGIQIDMGAEAVITGNTINGYTSHSDSWSACGVLVLRDGKITRIRNNTLVDCGIGIMKETYYDTDSDNTHLDFEAAKSNTFINCAQNVDFEFDLAEEIKSNSSGTIRLPCDVVLDEKLTINKDLILDGNGFTIYGQGDNPSVRIEVIGGTFHLSDVTLAGFGNTAVSQPGNAVIHVPATADPGTMLTASSVDVRDFNCSAYHIASGSFTISEGTIECSGSLSNGITSTSGIQIDGTAGKVTGSITGVTITGSQSNAAGENTSAIEIYGSGEVDVKGCVISHMETGIQIEQSGSDRPSNLAVEISTTNLSAREDALLLSSQPGIPDQVAVRILSGEFNGNIRVENQSGHDILSITGGCFSVDPTAYVASGYYVRSSNGMYFVHSEDTDEETPGGGGTSGGGSSGGSPDSPTPPAQPSDPETSEGNTTISTQVTPAVSGDTAKAEVDAGIMDKAVERVLEAALESNTAPVIQIVIDSGKASNVEVLLPVSSLDLLGKHESAALTVTSGVVTVTLDSAAITSVANQARGEQITLAVAPVAAEDLNEQQQAVVGSAPVFELHLKSDNGSIPHFGGGNATVSIPHILPDGHTADGVVVYYLDDLGGMTRRESSYSAAAGAVTFITPHFSKYMVGYKEISGNSFADVAETDYFYTPVLWAAERGITLGTSETTFSPHRACTRAQAAVLLWRAAGRPEPERRINPFTDVVPSADYYDAVLWAAEQGIISGTTETTFSPDAPCTRAQIVTLLWRYNKKVAVSSRSFMDVAPDTYYTDAVLWAAEQGITNGVTETAFLPNTPCTRAQIVTFLFRYMGE